MTRTRRERTADGDGPADSEVREQQHHEYLIRVNFSATFRLGTTDDPQRAANAVLSGAVATLTYGEDGAEIVDASVRTHQVIVQDPESYHTLAHANGT